MKSSINNKLLIVGSFPLKNSNIFGGIAKSCEILINSTYFDNFKILKLDSSQISNPKPFLFVRLYNAIKRIIKISYIHFIDRPQVVLIFCSDGLSAIEKGLMIFLSKLYGSKVLIFPRAGKLIEQSKSNKTFNNLLKTMFSKADIFLAQGEKWKKFANDFLDISNDKIKIINNWTATEELLNLGANKLIRNKSNLKILYIGWLEKEKGINELIHAIRALIHKKYKIELILIGDGSIRNKIEKFIAKNEINKYIKLKGWLKSKEIKNYLKEADIFILPSWQEGMPNSLIEAVSSGIPSIVSSVGVIPNYFRHLENILLIEPKNITNLQESIEVLINDYDLRKKLSHNGVLTAKNFFSEEKSLKYLSKIIKHL